MGVQESVSHDLCGHPAASSTEKHEYKCSDLNSAEKHGHNDHVYLFLVLTWLNNPPPHKDRRNSSAAVSTPTCPTAMSEATVSVRNHKGYPLFRVSTVMGSNTAGTASANTQGKVEEDSRNKIPPMGLAHRGRWARSSLPPKHTQQLNTDTSIYRIEHNTEISTIRITTNYQRHTQDDQGTSYFES
ncbi:hypothetical protein PR048_014077 [Dryococelus australis]|uniref:Uncharacterized protein n=1 Tax=Dryococelus australis TaxID=614101 RepID=A0ABQ9HUX0_9NEOP|nr:hypothetical protein PR048_014077 [Dryococelus australis]